MDRFMDDRRRGECTVTTFYVYGSSTMNEAPEGDCTFNFFFALNCFRLVLAAGSTLISDYFVAGLLTGW